MMKHFVIIGVCLFLFSFAARAETEVKPETKTMYISDIIKITLRTGSGTDHKIISMVNSGNKVTVVEPGENWSRVILQNGKEGWVLNRYLTPKQPCRIALAKLEKKYETLKVKLPPLLEENSTLKAENEKQSKELIKNSETLKKLSESYDALKYESAGFLKLKSNYEKTAKQLAVQTVDAKNIKEELHNLQTNRAIRWFISGAVVLIFGFIIGFSSKRQRRKSSLL